MPEYEKLLGTDKWLWQIPREEYLKPFKERVEFYERERASLVKKIGRKKTQTMDHFYLQGTLTELRSWKSVLSTVEKTHEEEVRKAVSNGENVPEAVLVDYPDLQRCSE